MAASARLGTFEARQVWRWVSVALSTTIVLAALMTVNVTTASYKSRLAEELGNSLDTHREAWGHGNYRALVESLVQKFPNLNLTIDSPFGHFEWGAPSRLVICVTSITEPGSLVACGTPEIPWLTMGAFLGGVLSLLGVILVALSKKEIQQVSLINELFEKNDLPAPVGQELAPLVSTVANIRRDLEEARAREVSLSRKARLGEAARRVAHDIRSPLSALKVLAGSPRSLTSSEGLDLFQQATDRILGIANDLSDHAKGTTEAPSDTRTRLHSLETIELISILRQAISEKCLEHTGKIHIEALVGEEHRVLVQARAAEIRRMVSNLLNNSLEALDSSRGIVTVRLKPSRSSVRLEIEDNGRGMPPEVLERLKKGAFSYGKASGSGIGVSSARKMVQEWGGTFAIDSQLGRGTKVLIDLARI